MPKRKKGRKTLHPHQESAAGDGELPHSLRTPQIMLEEPQSPQTLPQSPQRQQDPALSQQSPPPEGGGGEEPQAVSASPPPPSPLPSVPDAAAVPDLPPPHNPTTSSRKAAGKRRKPVASKRLAEIQEKLALLRHNLRPVPFAPGRAPDLPRHERLFRALGLWDFACLDLDRDLRPDLLAALIANYDVPKRSSSVNGARIMVSRADLARALTIPMKRDKAGPSDSDLEIFSAEESAAVVTDFMSNRMVFLEDACVLPEEVVTANRLVKEGQPHRVDWAGLMWTMVEKELLEAPRSGQCYYASHLQRLMKHQRPQLFETGVEPDAGHEPPVEVVLAEEEDDTGNGGGAARTGSLEDFLDTNPDNDGPALSLGLGGEDEAMIGLEGCKEEEGGYWLVDRKDTAANHCLRRCELKDVTSMECEGMSNEEEGRGGRMEEKFDDDLAEKFSSLERLNSTDLLHAMGTSNASYSMPVHPLDPSSGEFLAMGTETHKNMALDPGPAGQFLFGNNCKREIDEFYDDDNGDGMHELSEVNRQKRMRSDGPWEYAQSAFDPCMEQVQCWLGKAKMAFVEKEQAYMNAHLQLESMSDMLQQKDQIIRSLEKARMEEMQKRHRFEHEVKVMAQVIYGYKKALKEVRSAFDEYRKQFPLGDGTLYHDVGGAGGIVLSTGEMERLRLEKETLRLEKDTETRRVVMEMINDFQEDWFVKISRYSELVTKLDIKLGGLGEEFKLLRERFAL